VTREEDLADLLALLPRGQVLAGDGWPGTVRFFDGIDEAEISVYVGRIGEPGLGAAGAARPQNERRFQNPGRGHPIEVDPARPTLLLGLGRHVDAIDLAAEPRVTEPVLRSPSSPIRIGGRGRSSIAFFARSGSTRRAGERHQWWRTPASVRR